MARKKRKKKDVGGEEDLRLMCQQLQPAVKHPGATGPSLCCTSSFLHLQLPLHLLHIRLSPAFLLFLPFPPSFYLSPSSSSL